MDVDEVDGVQNILCSTALLIPVCKLTDGYRDVEARQILLRKDDLLGKLIVWENVIVEWLGTKLHASRDEFGQRIRVQGGEERVPSADPNIAAIEAELGYREFGFVDINIWMAYPYEGMHTEIIIPGRLYDVVAKSYRSQKGEGRREKSYLLEAFVVTCTIETDITSIEVMPDIVEFSVQLCKTLTCRASSAYIRPQ